MGEVIAVINNKYTKGDINNYFFESIVDCEFRIFQSSDYNCTHIMNVETPYIKVRTSGSNAYRNGAKLSLGWEREYYYWNNNNLGLVKTNKETVEFVLNQMLSLFVEKYEQLPDQLTKVGMYEYQLKTKRGIFNLRCDYDMSKLQTGNKQLLVGL